MTFARRIAVAEMVFSLAACNAQLDFHDVEDAADVGSDADDTPPSSCTTAGCPLPSLHCDPTSGTCVACLADRDCPISVRGPLRCDRTQNLCVECNDNDDCRPYEHCVTESHRCAPKCSTPGPCFADFTCDVDKGICGECKTDADCAYDLHGHHCEPSSEQCVECLTETQCPGDEYCDPASYRCVQCVRSTDCDQGQACDPVTHSCV